MRLSSLLAQNLDSRVGQKAVTVIENGQFLSLDAIRFLNDSKGAKPLGPIQAFMRSCWTAAAVLELLAGGDLPWQAWKRGRAADAKWERDPNDSREALLDRPGGQQTGKMLFTQVIYHRLLHGIAMLRWIRSTGSTSRLRILDPELCKIVTTKGERPAVFSSLLSSDALGYAASNRDFSEITGYRDETGERMEVEEVVRVQAPNPFGHGGLSPLVHLGIASAADFTAAMFNLKTMNEDGALRGILSDQAITNQEAINQATAAIEAHFRSGARVLVTGMGSNYMPMSSTHKDMEWRDGLELVAAQVCAILRVPISLFLPKMQSLGGGSTQEAAETALWRRGILPIMREIRDALNLTLVPPKESATTWINYDTSQVEALQQGLAEKSQIHERLVRNGITTDASIEMLELGCGPQPGGDLARYPSTLSPFDETPPEQGRKLPPPADAKL